MKNTFVVSACRFHTKETNKVVIVGTFQKNLIGDNQLIVLLDKRKLTYTLEERDVPISHFKSIDGILITKQYFLWIDLPDTWKECKELQVVNRSKDEQKVAVTVSTEKLSRLEKKIPKYVDKGIVEDDGFRIQGWYIDDGTVQVSFLDHKGNPYPVELKKKKRADVLRAYPENSEEDIIGFSARYRGNVPKKVKVHFESATKETDYVLTLFMSPVEKVVTKTSELSFKAKAYYRQFGAKAAVVRAIDKITKKESIEYKDWYKRQCPARNVLKAQRNYRFAYSPKISIVVPLYKTPEKYLSEMIESVRKQSYQNWELCLSDGSGEDSPIQKVLKAYEKKDSRIKVVYNHKQLQISDNTNAALDISTGDYIAFADHDDLLAPNALYECVALLNRNPETDIIYTDEDKVDMTGKEHFMPHFKSDFNIDMLCSVNYICHLFVVKREIYQKVGMLNSEFDGAQDYDFILRCVEKTKNIKHIPKILYHWRAHKDSTAENPESKNYAFEAGARAVQAHYDRLGIHATVSQTENKGIYRSKYELVDHPLVSVIIPNKDHTDDLEQCIRSLEEKSTYENIEYIIVENNSQEDETFAYYKQLEESTSKAKVVYWEGKGFNYPAINMYGVKYAKGDYLLFLNNDTEILNQDCIEELLGYCMRKDVGAVGARLYYEDGTIQHAGVIIGLGGVAGHAFTEYPHDALGYFGRIIMAQDYSAVTAACIMIKRSVFEEVGGFDERYAVAFNDVDLCLKIRKAGYLIVYNPYAELMHYESKSRGYEDSQEKVERFNSEIALFQTRWNKVLKQGDPYYNPNLTLTKNDFSLNVVATRLEAE